jgi:hypothetical protein
VAQWTSHPPQEQKTRVLIPNPEAIAMQLSTISLICIVCMQRKLNEGIGPKLYFKYFYFTLVRKPALHLNIEVHYVKSCDVEVHYVESHDVASHDVKSHGVESHDVKSHDFISHDVESHNVESHYIEVHYVKSRDVKSHDVKSHDVKSHDVKSHDVEKTLKTVNPSDPS